MGRLYVSGMGERVDGKINGRVAVEGCGLGDVVGCQRL